MDEDQEARFQGPGHVTSLFDAPVVAGQQSGADDEEGGGAAGEGKGMKGFEEGWHCWIWWE
jgi:hypothetical protein